MYICPARVSRNIYFYFSIWGNKKKRNWVSFWCLGRTLNWGPPEPTGLHDLNWDTPVLFCNAFCQSSQLFSLNPLVCATQLNWTWINLINSHVIQNILNIVCFTWKVTSISNFHNYLNLISVGLVMFAKIRMCEVWIYLFSP